MTIIADLTVVVDDAPVFTITPFPILASALITTPAITTAPSPISTDSASDRGRMDESRRNKSR